MLCGSCCCTGYSVPSLIWSMSVMLWCALFNWTICVTLFLFNSPLSFLHWIGRQTKASGCRPFSRMLFPSCVNLIFLCLQWIHIGLWHSSQSSPRMMSKLPNANTLISWVNEIPWVHHCKSFTIPAHLMELPSATVNCSTGIGVTERCSWCTRSALTKQDILP